VIAIYFEEASEKLSTIHQDTHQLCFSIGFEAFFSQNLFHKIPHTNDTKKAYPERTCQAVA